MLFGLLFLLILVAAIGGLQAQAPQLTAPAAENQARAFAGSFRATAHAALAYAEAHPGTSGTISPAALAPYMSGWVWLPSAQAQVTAGGLLVVSAVPTGGLGDAQWISRNLLEDFGDAAYGSVLNGQMVSANGTVWGTPPAGVVNGEALYVVDNP